MGVDDCACRPAEEKADAIAEGECVRRRDAVITGNRRIPSQSTRGRVGCGLIELHVLDDTFCYRLAPVSKRRTFSRLPTVE